MTMADHPENIDKVHVDCHKITVILIALHSFQWNSNSQSTKYKLFFIHFFFFSLLVKKSELKY